MGIGIPTNAFTPSAKVPINTRSHKPSLSDGFGNRAGSTDRIPAGKNARIDVIQFPTSTAMATDEWYYRVLEGA